MRLLCLKASDPNKEHFPCAFHLTKCFLIHFSINMCSHQSLGYTDLSRKRICGEIARRIAINVKLAAWKSGRNEGRTGRTLSLGPYTIPQPAGPANLTQMPDGKLAVALNCPLCHNGPIPVPLLQISYGSISAPSSETLCLNHQGGGTKREANLPLDTVAGVLSPEEGAEKSSCHATLYSPLWFGVTKSICLPMRKAGSGS